MRMLLLLVRLQLLACPHDAPTEMSKALNMLNDSRTSGMTCATRSTAANTK